MEFPLQICNYLQSVYAVHSTNGDSEVDNLVKPLRECIKKIKTAKITEISKLKMGLDGVRVSSHALMSSSPSNRGVELRQIYADSCITQCLLELMLDVNQEREMVWRECIRLLDGAIVFSGVPARMEIVQGLVRYIQHEKMALTSDPLKIYAPSPVSYEVELPTCGGMVPRIDEPDMISFLTTWCKSPFVISGGVAQWPALTSRPWASHQYLKSAAGRGRVVPVEIGKDYRLDNWSQEMMDWECFLEKVETGAEPLVYLAQHSLLAQFTELREDIIVPDFVYYAPSTEYEGYSPPANDDGLIINAWLGPKGTSSPAHQDPYFNCYAQVVGKKTVWLAPPTFTTEMSPLRSDSGLSNTTSLDVFSPITEEEHPLFVTGVLQESTAVTLLPGDLLFFPPGWWHAMRSEEKSFSVSFWF